MGDLEKFADEIDDKTSEEIIICCHKYLCTMKDRRISNLKKEIQGARIILDALTKTGVEGFHIVELLIIFNAGFSIPQGDLHTIRSIQQLKEYMISKVSVQIANCTQEMLQ